MNGQSRDTRTQATVWLVGDGERYFDTLQSLVDGQPDLQCPHAFEKGEQLLSHLGSSIPDVLVMDVDLPGIDGIETIRKARMIAPVIEVLILVEHEDGDVILSALCAGARDYLSRGQPYDEILKAIRSATIRGGATSPPIAWRVLSMFAPMSWPRVDNGLADVEKAVLKRLVQGKSIKRIARELSVDVPTIDSHLRSIYAQLDIAMEDSA